MSTFDPDGKVKVETRTRTDVMFQSFSVYIEGVQVPFIGINITSNLGAVPQMYFSIPSQSGILDISRYYEPKVHVFYKDMVTGKDCVLFVGIIVSSTYSKSSATPPQKSITFNCRYKYSQMDMITLDYSGYASDANSNVTDYNQNGAAIKVNGFNSLESINRALAGIDPSVSGPITDITVPNIAGLKESSGSYPYSALPQYLSTHANRMVGFPGVMLNFWNQLKAQVYEDPEYFEGMTRMFIPLVEQGLDFFKRLGGHYYLEAQLNNTRSAACPGEDKGAHPLDSADKLIPPCHKQFMISSVQAEVSAKIIYTMGQFSGEMTSFLKVLEEFLYSIEYDLVYLTSPAEVPMDPSKTDNSAETYAMDVLIKPQMPFYYSPLCNVWLPNMIDSVSVQQYEDSVPTRITVVNDLQEGHGGRFGVNYRAPQSIREAIARGNEELGISGVFSDLAGTTGSTNYKIGKYEQGRGVRHQRLMMPNWLAMLSESLGQQGTSESESAPASDSKEGLDVEKLKKAWTQRYDPSGVKAKLNPWDSSSGLNNYQRLLFSAADYKYTTEVAKARTGTVMGIFNPYVVAGYPTDIIEATPSDQSFHGFCVSVTHSISARSVSTSAQFVSAMTYQELGNYEQQYLHPWMTTALGLVNLETSTSAGNTGEEVYKTSIVNNAQGREDATKFYQPTLGVGAAPPEFLYDFSTGSPLPFDRDHGVPRNGVTDKYLSGEGNLHLVYRPIESKEDLEARMGIKFIDMVPGNYNPEVFSYQDPILDDSKLMEPGQSMFLNYADKIEKSKDEM